MFKVICLSLLSVLACSVAIARQHPMSAYNILWQNPGVNALGSVPLGNGDIGINAWIDGEGDLLFYVSKTDAWSENGQLMKLGLVRVSMSPAPLVSKRYTQELVLENGVLLVQMDNIQMKVWVDANHPTIQVDINSERPITAKVTLHQWRKKRYEVTGAETGAIYGFSELTIDKRFRQPAFMEPDTILPSASNMIWSCHQNKYSHWRSNLELQALGAFAQSASDPLLQRTFGLAIVGKNFTSSSDTSVISDKPSRNVRLNVCPLTNTGSIEQWKNTLLSNVAALQKTASSERWTAHRQWWRRFWNQHYIYVTAKDSLAQKETFKVTQGYMLQRYINACGGRGNAPIKFNGSIFTVDTYNRKGANAGLNADFRAWGGPFWFQNTRLPYWSMLLSGDFDMMEPLFKMYMNALPLRKLATSKYYQHEGAFFPETMNFWGTYTNANYGINRENLPDGYITNNYIRYYWSGGLELSLMMLDYYAFTRNNKFAQDILVPFVSEILTFFDQHWKRDEHGKILFSPAISLETYHTAVNPLPDIVGIQTVAEKMLLLPDMYTSITMRDSWRKLLSDLPAVPVRMDNGDTLLAPAEQYSNKQNVENPELYAVFPYRLYGTGKPGIDVARKTYKFRNHKEHGGWQQNSIQAAYLGLTDEAKQMVIESFSTHDHDFRFPAFWGPNYDWTPDQDHGSVAMITLQRMLMQYDNDQVFLLPAWPSDWDAEFKVNGPAATIIEGSFKNGRLTKKLITPANSLKVYVSGVE